MGRFPLMPQIILGESAVSLAEQEEAERNEYPQTVAHRAYAEAVLRTREKGYPVTDRERIAIRAALTALQRHYNLQAEPWVKRLSQIEALRPIEPMVPLQEQE